MKNLKTIVTTAIMATIMSASANAGGENSRKTIIHHDNGKANHVVIKDNKRYYTNNTTIIRKDNPGYHNDRTVIVNPQPKHNNTIIVNPKPKHNNTIIVNPKYNHWYRPHVPNWNHWNGHKVVIVDHYHYHDHYDAFRFAMGVIGMAIVIDQVTEKPYTEKGDEVIVETIKCKHGESGHTQVVEASDKVILLVCE